MSILPTSSSPFDQASDLFVVRRASFSQHAPHGNQDRLEIPTLSRSHSHPSTWSRTSSHSVKFENFSLHFDLPLKAAAEKFGVRATAFKKRCRAIGIRHWPYRKVRSLKRSIQELTRCKENGSMTEKQRFQHQTYKRDLDRLMSPETYGIEASRDLEFFTDDDEYGHDSEPSHSPSGGYDKTTSPLISLPQNPFAARQRSAFSLHEHPSGFRSSPNPQQNNNPQRPAYDDITFLNCMISNPQDMARKTSNQNPFTSSFTTEFVQKTESPRVPQQDREKPVIKMENNQHFHEAFAAPYSSSEASNSSEISESFPFNDDLDQIDYIGNEKHFLDDIFVELSPIHDCTASN